MKLKSGLTFSVLFSLFLIFASLNDAEARRFGGGGNFGGRSTYSSPYQRSTQPPTRSANPSQQQAGKQAPGANPGLMRPGLTGFLGGLMMGGLLGSLFGMGGFHGANLIDFLVLGGLIYLAYRFFAARSAQRTASAYGRAAGYDAGQPNTKTTYDYANNGQNTGSAFDTDILFKNKPATESQVNNDADFSPVQGNIPPGFDEQGFLSGAKIAYGALQKAWDARDLADIRGLTTDKVFAEIQDQLKASNEENHTDVLKLTAELLDVREIGNEIEAVVLFDAIMREDSDGQAGQVREVWHFIKPNNPSQTKWLLDGIQQLSE